MKTKLVTVLLALYAMSAQAQTTPEEKLNMAMYAVTNMYVDSIDKSKFVDAEIAKILKSLDPFSEYLPPMVAKANEDAILGHVPSPQGNVQAQAPAAKNTYTPAQGPSTIKSYYMANKTTGYICLTMFAETTISDFKKAITELKTKGMKDLVLDLRNNGGGLFDVAVALADEFLDGDKVIVQTKGAHVSSETFKAKTKGVMEKGRLVLLVSDQTKSAAEIFSAAIRDWDRGLLVGKTTFGKGLIQETLPFSDGSALRITVARYVTPAGMSIQKPYNGMAFADSTRVWKSMLHHRPLLCRGGVEADVKVDAQTDYMTNWYALITYSGVQSAVGRKFVEDLKDSLMKKYPTADKFIRDFSTSDDLMKAVRKTAEGAGIPTSSADYDKSESMVKVQMKAVICSQLYHDNNLYYKLFNENNDVVKRAMEIIGSNEYNKILNGK